MHNNGELRGRRSWTRKVTCGKERFSTEGFPVEQLMGQLHMHESPVTEGVPRLDWKVSIGNRFYYRSRKSLKQPKTSANEAPR